MRVMSSTVVAPAATVASTVRSVTASQEQTYIGSGRLVGAGSMHNEGRPLFDQLGGQVQADGDGMSQPGAHANGLGARVTVVEDQADRPDPPQVQLPAGADRPVRLSCRFTHSAVPHTSELRTP
jgi:hypothetical protein